MEAALRIPFLSSVAQPLQTVLHDGQVADFLSWHTKCSPEQTRETCYFNCQRVDMGQGFIGWGFKKQFAHDPGLLNIFKTARMVEQRL